MIMVMPLTGINVIMMEVMLMLWSIESVQDQTFTALVIKCMIQYDPQIQLIPAKYDPQIQMAVN